MGLSLFTIYEESISESCTQVQAIMLIISMLQGTRVFGLDYYDMLITKATCCTVQNCSNMELQVND